MYLVKALSPGTGPAAAGKLVRWSANQVRLVSDEAQAFYARNTEGFTVLAGPDFNDCLAAAAVELDALQLPNSVQILSGSAAPTNYDLGVQASLLVSSAGDADNDLTFTAVAVGVAGNDFTVTIVQGAGVSVPLSVAYVDGDATITLPTDGSSVALAATANQVKTAWDASAAVSYITVAVGGTGADAVAVAAVASLAGGVDTVAGTGGGVAGPGSLYVATTPKTLHINVGSIDEPTWEAFTSA